MPIDPPELSAKRENTTSWPSIEFLYPEDKPEVGTCVDFPKGVCQGFSSIWKPSHLTLGDTRTHGPRLRLEIHLIVSGFEVRVANEGDVLAQGVNVDVMGWQTGAPGAEWIKSYRVHDLGPFADYTIQEVFGNPFTENRQ